LKWGQVAGESPNAILDRHVGPTPEGTQDRGKKPL